MRFKRPHPINIENTTKYILLLVFLIRGLLFSHGDFYTWLKGAWFDLFDRGADICNGSGKMVLYPLQLR